MFELYSHTQKCKERAGIFGNACFKLLRELRTLRTLKYATMALLPGNYFYFATAEKCPAGICLAFPFTLAVNV